MAKPAIISALGRLLLQQQQQQHHLQFVVFQKGTHFIHPWHVLFVLCLIFIEKSQVSSLSSGLDSFVPTDC